MTARPTARLATASGLEPTMAQRPRHVKPNEQILELVLSNAPVSDQFIHRVTATTKALRIFGAFRLRSRLRVNFSARKIVRAIPMHANWLRFRREGCRRALATLATLEEGFAGPVGQCYAEIMTYQDMHKVLYV